MAGSVLEPPDLGGPFPFFFDRGCYQVVRRVMPKAATRACRSGSSRTSWKYSKSFGLDSVAALDEVHAQVQGLAGG